MKKIAKFFQAREMKKMETVLFDCEATIDNQRLCAHVGVEHYPSVLFVGYGSYRRNDFMSNKLLGKKRVPERSVMYAGELYFESVRDWVRTMRFFSRLSRLYGRMARLLGYGMNRGKEEVTRLDALRRENAALKAKAAEAAAEAKKSGKNEQLVAQSVRLAKEFGTKGDTFSYLSDRGYGRGGAQGCGGGANASSSSSLPSNSAAYEPPLSSLHAVKRCVAEVTGQHCDGQGGDRAEPFCDKVEACRLADFESLECRPATCPLHPEGCLFTSICLHPSIVKAYEDASAKGVAKKAPPKGTSAAAADGAAGCVASSGDGAGASSSSRAGVAASSAAVGGGGGGRAGLGGGGGGRTSVWRG